MSLSVSLAFSSLLLPTSNLIVSLTVYISNKNNDNSGHSVPYVNGEDKHTVLYKLSNNLCIKPQE